MADYAIQLLSDPAPHASFSEAAHQRAAAHFDYHDIVAQYIALYERVLGEQ